MHAVKTNGNQRGGFTLLEMVVVIAIILAIAVLAAAFVPRVSDSQNLTRAIDQFEQWLLTAKVRAKRDGLTTGLRFLQNSGDAPGTYSQFQYVQQPDPISGGWLSATKTSLSVPYNSHFLTGGILQSAAGGNVTFANVDFTLGGIPQPQWLVQPGDYLEVRDGGVYQIGAVTGPATLKLAGTSYDTTLTIGPSSVPPTQPTTSYRILRQPRILIGEPPLQMPGSLVVDMNVITGTKVTSNVVPELSGNLEILFAPSGAVIGKNGGSGKVLVYVHDILQSPQDPNRAGIIAVQTRTGFIGAYSVAPGPDPFVFAEEGRSSGL
jgi:prepilin-type N-terminal cleavage/methylation domain-containing protein